ncbi:hypothetical protein B0H19DRAFT_1243816 [Mycena capillaripes]|nr:hypothetical protein B0H19DRAFT_1243816 [Mycena capillaripes]
MFPFVPRTTVSALSVLLCLSSIYVASGQSCGCSSIVIPVHVDVFVSKDPADPFGGLKSNASSLRRLDDTYDVFGVFCQPNTVSPKNADVIQLLVHGFTYTNQYWSPPTEEFRNNSYSEFACDRGLSSLAIDWVGVGLSSRPANASDVQYATGAAVLSQLARHLKTTSIFPGIQPFKKIIGIGHSAGSIMLTFGAILESAKYPFDGLILTSSLNTDLSTLAPLLGATSARDDTPSGGVPSTPIISQRATAAYSTPPTRPHFRPAWSYSTLALTAAERMLWPEAQNFEIVVAQGSGHDMNLDFFAKGPFNTFVGSPSFKFLSCWIPEKLKAHTSYIKRMPRITMHMFAITLICSFLLFSSGVPSEPTQFGPPFSCYSNKKQRRSPLSSGNSNIIPRFFGSSFTGFSHFRLNYIMPSPLSFPTTSQPPSITVTERVP